jgi:hypothetical protein
MHHSFDQAYFKKRNEKSWKDNHQACSAPPKELGGGSCINHVEVELFCQITAPSPTNCYAVLVRRYYTTLYIYSYMVE